MKTIKIRFHRENPCLNICFNSPVVVQLPETSILNQHIHMKGQPHRSALSFFECVCNPDGDVH